MNKKLLIIGAVVLVLLGVGFWFWITQRGSSEEAQPVEETFITEEPEPTEEAEFEKSDFSIQVLNGSGKAGLAGTVQTTLEDAGYTMGAEADNADNPNYENTIIKAKSDVPEGFIDMLKDELSDYGTIETEDLDEDETVDVIIIIGGQQEEDTEEAEESEEETDTTPAPTEEASESTSSGDTD